jgi:hypothetical protein
MQIGHFGVLSLFSSLLDSLSAATGTFDFDFFVDDATTSAPSATLTSGRLSSSTSSLSA